MDTHRSVDFDDCAAATDSNEIKNALNAGKIDVQPHGFSARSLKVRSARSTEGDRGGDAATFC